MYRWDINLTAKGCLNHGNREITIYCLFITLEKIMFLYVDNHIQVSGRTASAPSFAFATQAHLSPGIHTGWDLQRDFFLFINQTTAPTVITGLCDNFPFAMALGTS